MITIRTPEETGYKKVFVVGCPRSGTTWVQLLLAQIDKVATAPETQIFAYYLAQFERQWRIEQQDPDSSQGKAGLSRVLSEAEFEAVCRTSALAVLEKIRSSRPGSTVVVEKSPKHALHAEFIKKLFPDAYFLHVIRDPRDVAVSLKAAAGSWGASWAPRSAVAAARMWVDHVEQARRIADGAGTYCEVLYESIRSDSVAQLTGVIDWLGLDVDHDAIERAVAACEFKELRKLKGSDQMPLPGTKSPEGFFRKGEVGGWRTELSKSEVRAIEYIAGPLMRELGYLSTNGRSVAPARVRLHDGLQRVRESIDWQLARLIQRL